MNVRSYIRKEYEEMKLYILKERKNNSIKSDNDLAIEWVRKYAKDFSDKNTITQ